MTNPNVEDLRQQLAVAQAEVDRLTEALQRAEWLRDYENAEGSHE